MICKYLQFLLTWYVYVEIEDVQLELVGAMEGWIKPGSVFRFGMYLLNTIDNENIRRTDNFNNKTNKVIHRIINYYPLKLSNIAQRRS